MYLILEVSLNKGKDMKWLNSMQIVYALAKERILNYKMNRDGREKS